MYIERIVRHSRRTSGVSACKRNFINRVIDILSRDVDKYDEIIT